MAYRSEEGVVAAACSTVRLSAWQPLDQALTGEVEVCCLKASRIAIPRWRRRMKYSAGVAEEIQVLGAMASTQPIPLEGDTGNGVIERWGTVGLMK